MISDIQREGEPTEQIITITKMDAAFVSVC